MSTIKSQPKQTTTANLDDFVVLGKLGEGSFSTVHKARRITDGKIYALKKINMKKLKSKEKQSAINQIRILASVKSEFIICYRQSFYVAEREELYIVMEWANEGDLWKDIESYSKSRQKIPESEIWRAIRDILCGLNILHQSSIIHRDIKSANIFKSEGFYKLGDLNIAKINRDLAYTQLGTPFYASPEVWDEKPYDYKSDIWSFGCVIYEMCQLQPPFKGGDMHKLHQNIANGRYNPIPRQYSNQLGRFVHLCLKTDPRERPKADELLELCWVKERLKQYNIQVKIKAQSKSQLLQTLVIPQEAKRMTEVLPEANYNNKNSRFIIKKQIKSVPLRKKINTDLVEDQSKKFFLKKKRNLKSAKAEPEIQKNKSVLKDERISQTAKKRPITADSKQNYYIKKTPSNSYRIRYNPDIISSLEIRKSKISRENSYSNYSRESSYRKDYGIDGSQEKQIRQKLGRPPLSSIYANKYQNSIYMAEPLEIPQIRNLVSQNGEKIRKEIGKLYSNNVKKNLHCLYP